MSLRSFRARLRLFFVIIVIMPMIAVALVLFRVVTDSERGKSDARLGQAQRGTTGLYESFQRRAEASAGQIGRDLALARYIADRNRPAISRRLRALADENGVVRLEFQLNRVGRFSVGRGQGVAPARSRVDDAAGRPVGRMGVSVISPTQFASAAARVTGLEIVVSQGARILASTLTDAPADLPARGSAKVAGRDFRVASFQGPAFEGRDVTIRVLADERAARSNISESSVIVAVALLAFLALAFAFALFVSRKLQEQISNLLQAAKRLGAGEFDIQVPTEGNDEFAALGREFNSMARELQERLEELSHERTRLQDAIRRVGESFSRGLDRDAQLGIAVQTAVDGLGADAGRATVRDAAGQPLRQLAGQGDLSGQAKAIHAVEAAVLDAGQGAETHVGDVTALAEPLYSEDGKLLGLLTVSRAGRTFSRSDRDLLHYLATQAAVSIENAELHSTVQRQAVTDELTGLSNHRRFQEVMASEVERAKRFEQDLGLIMLDLDNFKQVNDTYGHRQGDLVLREVGRVLRESAREIDEPARYGGEEMAVVLPQTDLEGAYQFAERVRHGIAELELPIIEGEGTLKVTASLGVASLSPNGNAAKDTLVAAADAALYQAKRTGKNRTIRAG